MSHPVSRQLKHLKKDKVLAAVIDAVGSIELKEDLDLYQSLLRAIVGQQLSVKAAKTIWQRFTALFPDGYPSAASVMQLTDDEMRSVGLSFQKAGYIRNIALFSQTHTLDYHHLKSMDDESLIQHLVQIKGVGRWTVEMILMFNLNRPNVLPVDDLGIQKGIIALYKLRQRDKTRLLQRMKKLASAWEPYRTLACMYVWKYNDSLARPESAKRRTTGN